MALAARALFRSFLTRNAGLNSRNTKGVALSRNAVTSTSGAILPKPDKVPFGVVRMAVVVAPFLYSWVVPCDWGSKPFHTPKITLSGINAITYPQLVHIHTLHSVPDSTD
ncbi:hypothetical protein AMELA_G00233840 [Ameiurus melas]|uniref:Essential MCU regulator, mitochondrial n=1 Tax=Ameiurus melas TaxID=219545 RepID=A0A7J5ZXM3_AMEME|nr:hypothetical protein AMELA_G00233840 [Ameiurus melas]